MYVLVMAPVEIWQVVDIMLLTVWAVSSSTKPAWVLSECEIILDLTASKSDRNLRTVQQYFAASHLCLESFLPLLLVFRSMFRDVTEDTFSSIVTLLSWDPWLCFGSFFATLDAGVKTFFSWFTPVRIRHPSAAGFLCLSTIHS